MTSSLFPPASTAPGFRDVPRTGVIFVMTEAAKAGYTPSDPSWSNLGQGAPETGPLPGGIARVTSIPVEPDDYEYSRVDGDIALRRAVATLYNERFRIGKRSQYTEENVAISSGGRVGLTRIVSALGRTNIGHILPDYTAYEELLEAFDSFVPIPILPSRAHGYLLSLEELEREILGRGLSAILLSNPANPTGQLLEGDTLRAWVDLARSHECSLIFDEFYSHYLYGCTRLANSAAECVEDVNKDPIIIVDGLTKNWRYPGFRLSWTVGPRAIVEAISSAGSFLDGGPSQPIQRIARTLVTRVQADQEARSIQSHFSAKRSLLMDGLRNLGIKVDSEPKGAFYCWADLSELPQGLRDGMNFFEAALKVGVIVVPGEFFDINPGQRRPERQSRFQQHARISFGPSTQSIEGALKRLKTILPA